MARLRKATPQDLLRLDAIAKHVGVKSRYPSSAFFADVAAACLARTAKIIDALLPCTGEEIALALGRHFSVTFEEVYGPEDIDAVEHRYLKTKKEIGFAQLRKELATPGVDALLFERMNATELDADRWVAVLNLQESAAKAYWNRFHELAHRIAEPPQMILPFRRHRFEAAHPVEALVDTIAAQLAFYPPAVKPLVRKMGKGKALDFEVVESFKAEYAPTASLLSAMNAVVRYWPRPAVVLTAAMGGRRNAPAVDRALRIAVQGHNTAADSVGLVFIPNMRAPAESAVSLAFKTKSTECASENLGTWTTSDGTALTSIDISIAARGLGSTVYALVSSE